MLFNLYIDDVNEIFDDSCEPILFHGEKLSHFLHADDLVVIPQKKEGLQNSLDKLSTFAAIKCLTVSTKKSKTMIFKTAGKGAQGPYCHHLSV